MGVAGVGGRDGQLGWRVRGLLSETDTWILITRFKARLGRERNGRFWANNADRQRFVYPGNVAPDFYPARAGV
jgi:hypothetical protein